jgi:hypothetical protein
MIENIAVSDKRGASYPPKEESQKIELGLLSLSLLLEGRGREKQRDEDRAVCTVEQFSPSRKVIGSDRGSLNLNDALK